MGTKNVLRALVALAQESRLNVFRLLSKPDRFEPTRGGSRNRFERHDFRESVAGLFFSPSLTSGR